MRRIFTKRIVCRACGAMFTITSAASKFCKDRECVSKRHKADRLALKEARARAATNNAAVGSDAHLARALRTGE